MSSNNSKNVCNFVKRRKNNLIKVFGSKCCICGFDDFQEALEFHHVDESTKEFGITQSSTTRALDKQLEEMKKCILVCSNCHRGIHQGYYQIPENWKELYQEEVAQQLLKERDEVRTHKIYYCPSCGTQVTEKGNYCVPCSKLKQRTVERPSREELKTLIRTKPFTQIANMFGVSDNAIRKWCKFENLPSKKIDINNYSDEDWENI